jgi:hypothetical protein
MTVKKEDLDYFFKRLNEMQNLLKKEQKKAENQLKQKRNTIPIIFKI